MSRSRFRPKEYCWSQAKNGVRWRPHPTRHASATEFVVRPRVPRARPSQQQRESLYRRHGSWPAFQHLAEQVVVGGQRTKHRSYPNGRNVKDTMGSVTSTERDRRVRRHHSDLQASGKTNTFIQDHNAILDMTTSDHEITSGLSRPSPVAFQRTGDSSECSAGQRREQMLLTIRETVNWLNLFTIEQKVANGQRIDVLERFDGGFPQIVPNFPEEPTKNVKPNERPIHLGLRTPDRRDFTAEGRRPLVVTDGPIISGGDLLVKKILN